MQDSEGGPLFDSPLNGSYNKFGEQELAALKGVIEGGRLFSPYGDVSSRLCKSLAEEFGVARAVLTSSGTAAVHVALGAAEVDFGDEVITTPITDTGTVMPILLQGAVPVFADVDTKSMMITAETIEPKITARTKAIVVVHYGGFPADLSPIIELAAKCGLTVIEDCAHAQGAIYQGKRVGSIGDLGAFSVNDTKHTSCGDGGFVLARQDVMGKRAALFSDKGFDRETQIRNPAFAAPNYRMTELQAAVLETQWQKLEERVSARAAFAMALDAIVDSTPGLTRRSVSPGDRSSYFSYFMSVEDGPTQRAKLLETLSTHGIPAHAGNLFDVQYSLDFLHSGRPKFFNFLGREYEYKRGLCPIAEETLDHMVRLNVFETFGQRELDVFAQALGTFSDSLSTGEQPTLSKQIHPETHLGRN